MVAYPSFSRTSSLGLLFSSSKKIGRTSRSYAWLGIELSTGGRSSQPKNSMNQNRRPAERRDARLSKNTLHAVSDARASDIAGGRAAVWARQAAGFDGGTDDAA